MERVAQAMGDAGAQLLEHLHLVSKHLEFWKAREQVCFLSAFFENPLEDGSKKNLKVLMVFSKLGFQKLGMRLDLLPATLHLEHLHNDIQGTC